MVRRLVLGCGVVGQRAIETLDSWPGEMRVIDADGDRVDALRGEGIAADRGDPGDPDRLRAEPPPDVVLVASDDAGEALRATRAADEAFPDAHLIAYTSGDGEARERIAGIADRTTDAAEAVAGAALTAADGDAGERVRGLASALRAVDGRLGVFMHNDPDPDAIGSAIALRDVALARGVDAEACYFGEIAHQENRALVNLLDIDLRHLDAESFDPAAFEGIALVDHSRPGVNDGLPPDTEVDVVIDHHPPRGAVDAGFVDLRSDVGATSTLLVDYLRGLDVDVDDRVATALLYGIRVDTRDFGRDITARDFEAAAFLLSRADMSVLERVERPSISGDTFDTIARAIKNCEREGSIVVSSAGQVANRDAIAQAADRLLATGGISLAVVFGFMNGTAYVSGRTQESDVDIGETMRRAFAGMGSAGGHTDMAGAQLPIGVSADADSEESAEAMFGEVITGRLFEELDVRWSPPRFDPGTSA